MLRKRGLMAGKRIGVVLCGSGHRDGSEIHEATLTLLAIDRAGAEAVCFAPKGPQGIVRDHLTGAEQKEKRDILVESARIARGKVAELSLAKEAQLDALVIPGGQGAGINLSSFVADGAKCSVDPDLAELVREMLKAKKPIGAMCLAPAALARMLGESGVCATLTMGKDDGAAKQVEAMGQKHEECKPTECVVDRENRIVTTPAYMNARSIGEVWQGVEKFIGALIEMA